MSVTRRTFLKQAGVVSVALANPVILLPAGQTKISALDPLLEKLAAINDTKATDLLAQQIHDPGGRWHGGLAQSHGIPNPHSTSHLITTCGAAYICHYSQFYQQQRLLDALIRASECLLRAQHSDGTVDLYSTNFHSTPDAAFLVNYLAPLYQVLLQQQYHAASALTSNLGEFISNAGEALRVGGIHTANHRWVVCAALARVHQIDPRQANLDRIDEWLSEGIDIDPDGQYTERSVGTYSAICDNMFLTLGRLLNRPVLLDVVRRNLEMTLYYIHPGGEVFTEASGRQDSAQTRYVHSYYYAYRYFAIADQNPKFAAVCDLLEREMPQRITRFISYLLELAELQKPLPPAGNIPDNYSKHFRHSGVIRIRSGNADMSIIENNPTFLAYRKGDSVMQSMRLSAAFFGYRGRFLAEDVQYDARKVTLKMTEIHGYYQPFPQERRTGDGDWHKMPRSDRKLTEQQRLTYVVQVNEKQGSVEVDLRIDGTPDVPVCVELNFRSGGTMHGVAPAEGIAQGYFLSGNTSAEYRAGDDVIAFGPGKCEHKWAQMRGMLPKQSAETVYLTGYTPFAHKIKIS